MMAGGAGRPVWAGGADRVAPMNSKMLAVLAAVAVALAAFAVPAGAAKKATKSQTAVIAKAVSTTPVGGANKLDKSWYSVSGVKISTVSKSWAVATQTPTKAGNGKFQPAFFILVQPAGTKQWVVVDIGTSGEGCGIAPNSVLSDLLGIKGDPCPGDEGIPN
jgi:hypothetical protein